MTEMSNKGSRAGVLAGLSMALLFVPMVSIAAGAGIGLQSPGNDVADVASLQRGVANFANYCLGCHTAQYIRYSKLQEDLRLTGAQVQENLMFAANSVDETMTIAMPRDDAGRWFGQPPPDLTLVARSRGTAWLYTFLRTFYVDDRAPTGMNNLVLPNASMPHVLWELQGLQQATFSTTTDSNGQEVGHFGEPAYFEGFEPLTVGELTPEQYDQFVRDLVNFLDWAGTPEQLQRRTLGIWVMIFLFVFLIFAYLLKVEIWKDVK